MIFTPSRNITLSEAVDEYIENRTASGAFRETTARNRRLELSRYVEFARSKGVESPHLVHKNLLTAYLKSLKVSNGTRRTILAVVSGFHDYLVDEELALENVADSFARPRIHSPEADYLTEPEMRRFFQAVVDGSFESAVDRNLLAATMLTGLCLRVSEVTSLKICDLDLSSTPGALRVHRKGGKEARIPLNSQIRELLDRWLEQREGMLGSDRPWLFLSNRGERLSCRQVQNLVRRALDKAGIVKRKMGPHLLRHSGASKYLAGGVDIKTIQHLLGHSNLSTTSRYVHSGKREMERAVEGFEAPVQKRRRAPLKKSPAD